MIFILLIILFSFLNFRLIVCLYVLPTVSDEACLFSVNNILFENVHTNTYNNLNMTKQIQYNERDTEESH